MSAPATWTAVQQLSNEMENFQALYISMMATAAAFVAAYTALAADSSNTVISSSYRSWATTLSGQVSNFIGSSATPPPP